MISQFFQTIWSARVVTERKAWELLSLLDQIHMWAKTDFRNFVIEHLEAWHEFAEKCYINDVAYTLQMETKLTWTREGRIVGKIPPSCLIPPEWARHTSRRTRRKLKKNTALFLADTYLGLVADDRVDGRRIRNAWSCNLDGCRASTAPGPGYPLTSFEEAVVHFLEIHGQTDIEILARSVDDALQGSCRDRPASEASHGASGVSDDMDLDGPLDRP